MLYSTVLYYTKVLYCAEGHNLYTQCCAPEGYCTEQYDSGEGGGGKAPGFDQHWDMRRATVLYAIALHLHCETHLCSSLRCWDCPFPVLHYLYLYNRMVLFSHCYLVIWRALLQQEHPLSFENLQCLALQFRTRETWTNTPVCKA